MGWLHVVSDGQLTNFGRALVAEGHRCMQPQSNVYHTDGGPVINFEAIRQIRKTSETSALLVAHNNNEHGLQLLLSPESVGKLLWAWHCWCYANGRQCLTE